MHPFFTTPLHKSNIHWVPVSPVACIISATSPDNLGLYDHRKKITIRLPTSTQVSTKYTVYFLRYKNLKTESRVAGVKYYSHRNRLSNN